MHDEAAAYGCFREIYLALRLLEKYDPRPFRADEFNCEVDDVFDRLADAGFVLGQSVLMNSFNQFLNEFRRQNRKV